MGIGAYRHLVTLTDLNPALVLVPSTWHCQIQSAATQVVDGVTAFYVRGRYHPGITLETQLVFEGRTFQVQSVTDVDERHIELVLMCVEVVGRGREPVTN
jgi:Phage head-tail joining protein